MTTYREPAALFLSYAHEDELLLRKLETHLSLLKRQGLISMWHDRLLQPGNDWAREIDSHLNQASVILLLISADFLVSDYCYGIEMKRALERQEAGEVRVIPILLRSVDWKGAPFGHLQALPTDAKPITAWSNEDTALTDVAAGIRRVIEDLPLLAASAPRAALPAIWNIPYSRNPFFLGRDGLLSSLHRQLQVGQAMALSQSPQAISGLGGIGKTQIAIEYAYRYHQEYEAVLWARAENLEALTSSYSVIAILLKLPEREAKEQEIMIHAVKIWLQTHTNWLLILDNADDLDLLPPFLPPVPGGHTLLTTRAWDMQRLAQRIEVETLPSEQGALFLLRRVALLAPDALLEQALPRERALALQLTQDLGGLPLALDQAGAYLEATGMSLEQYRQVYELHRQTILHERRARVPDHPEPTATTWSLSFQRVEQRNPAAADLLRLCAFLAPDAIPEEIITQGAPDLGPLLEPTVADPFLFGQAIEALRAYSLLNRDPRTQTLSVHRLVQTVLRDNMDVEVQQQWKQRAVLAANASCPNVDDMAQWSTCERWLPHAQVCAVWIEQEQMTLPEAARLLNQAGYYLKQRARYGEAEPLFKHALSIGEQQLGPQHPYTAASLSNLALLYKSQGKYSEAEPLFKRTLAIGEQQLGPQHRYTATSLDNLAGLYVSQGKYSEAEPLYQRALSIREQQLGSQHPATATSLNSLAELYRRQGKYAEAESLFKRALSIREQQLGSQHPDTARSLNDLAGLHVNQGEYGKAEPLYQRALSIYEQRLGPQHPDTARSLNGLAELYRRQGKYSEAEPLYQRALSIWERTSGSEYPHTQNARRNYASLLRATGRDDEAKMLERGS